MSNLAIRSIARQVRDLNVAKVGFTSFYVDGTNGSDSYTGESWNQAFATIQHAVDTAESWAKIFVKSLASSLLTGNASAAQKNVAVTDASDFIVGQKVQIVDDNATEINEVASIAGNMLTMTTNLANTYTTAANAGSTGIYNENVTISNDFVELKGEDADTTVIFPTADNAVLVYGNSNHVHEFTLKSNAVIHLCLYMNGNYNIAHDCYLEASQTPLAVHGVKMEGDHNEVYSIYVRANRGVYTGVVLEGNYSKVHHCKIDGAYFGITDGNDLIQHCQIYENDILNCTKGIDLIAATSINNSIYHNNIINNTTQVADAGANEWFENFYDDHTVDTNNDGLCDSPYVFTTGTDHQPVSRRNGWKQISLGGIGDASANPFIAKGAVTTATSSTVFASTNLIGYGNDAFVDWHVYVFHDAGGTGVAPQGQSQPISGYVSSTGTFTHTAFTTPLAVGDKVFILHPYEATGGDATEAKQDIIIANQAGIETISSTDLPNDTAENIVITIATTKRLKLDSVWLDFSNLVQDVTIKVYHMIDGSAYCQYDSFSWSTSEEDGIFLHDITINGDWKLTVTSSVAQGAIKAIPYNVIKTTMEA